MIGPFDFFPRILLEPPQIVMQKHRVDKTTWLHITTLHIRKSFLVFQ